MGAGLVLLLAKSAVELNKMVELRKQMEILLTDIRNEIDHKKDVSFSVAESKTALISHSDCYEYGSISNCISYKFSESAENAVRDNTGGGKDRMEEELLEVELERLRLNVEEKNSSVHLRQDETEEKHYSGGNELAEEQSPPHSGVSARELERRLHELLETRQKERIAELESALECAERDLREKEREISWWRRSARLVSQHREEKLL
ncbi:Protein POLAR LOCALIZATION DURING ASYMMETRIC DIVISION AND REDISTRIBUTION, partial [Ananas comosus]